MNLKLLCTQVILIAEKTGKYLKQQQHKITLDKIEKKGLNDFVTYMDKESERRLINFIKPLINGASFLVEEKTVKARDAEYVWIIDPLDGTTNYIHGISPYAISIALQHHGKTIMGVVYEVSLNEIFYAYEGVDGAYLNNRLMHVSQPSEHNEALIAVGFPYNDFNKLDSYMKSMDFFMQHTQGIRRLGSAATDLVYTACGRFEAFYEYSLEPWDVAAGAYIVQKAGGKVSDFKGGDDYIFGGEIIAANHNYFDKFLASIKDNM
ncbi:MAG: inositol monophosphatase family protein [Bacteroidales bacterium]